MKTQYAKGRTDYITAGHFTLFVDKAKYRGFNPKFLIFDFPHFFRVLYYVKSNKSF